MITKTSLKNPRFAKRIKRMFWLAKMESIKAKKRSTQYIKNRKGSNCIRLDVYPNGEMVAYVANGGMKNYASLLVDIVNGI